MAVSHSLNQNAFERCSVVYFQFDGILFKIIYGILRTPLEGIFASKKMYVCLICYPVDFLIREERLWTYQDGPFSRNHYEINGFYNFWRNRMTSVVFKMKLVFLAEFIIDSVVRPFQNLVFEKKCTTMAFETSSIEYLH